MLNIRWMALARFLSGYSMPDFSNLAFFFRSAFELCSLRVSQHRSPQAHNLSLRPRCHQSHLSDLLAHNLPPRRQKCLTAATGDATGDTPRGTAVKSASQARRHTICLFAVKSASPGRVSPSHHLSERGSMCAAGYEATTFLTHQEAAASTGRGASTLEESHRQYTESTFTILSSTIAG